MKKLPAFLCTKSCLALPSQKKARQLLEAGKCSVNGQVRTFASTVVCAGDTVTVVQEESAAKKSSIAIVYEDESLFVVDKPPGLQCEQALFEKALSRPCCMVHRLDKETSGLVLVANDSSMAKQLQTLFLRREISKRYLAIVDGRLQRHQGTIRASLQLHNRIGSSAYWGVSHDGGKSAHSEYKVVVSQKAASLVILTPHTGRTHQLRVHMASIGHPVLGDYHYAHSFVCPMRPDRHLLHAWRLEFMHPMLNRLVRCQSEIPTDFQTYATKLFGSGWAENL